MSAAESLCAGIFFGVLSIVTGIGPFGGLALWTIYVLVRL